MTPKPKVDVVFVCPCTSEHVFERMHQEVGIGEGLKGDFCFLEHSVLFRRKPSNDLEITPKSTPSM